MKNYGSNLYAFNARGEAWLDRSVTRSTFNGPPLVFAMQSIANPVEPADITAIVSFAATWDAPLVGFNISDALPPASWNAAPLLAGCASAAANGCFSVSPIVSADALPIISRLTGPWIAYARQTVGFGPDPASRDAWDALAFWKFQRSSQHHRYQLGMQGVSWFTPSPLQDELGSPLYVLPYSVDRAAQLAVLTAKWQISESKLRNPTVSQHENLANAAALRPGLARLCNPGLIPELALARPPS